MSTATDVLVKLSKDIKNAAKSLSPQEARYFADTYYQMQEFRKACGNQLLALEKSEEPNEAIQWLTSQFELLEGQVKRMLAAFSSSQAIGQWAESIIGIGPVISAGLIAHIDITKCPTVGHLWSFAGLDPSKTWEKKNKRPWNAQLKTLCWKIGESFVKVSGLPTDIYGKVWIARKELETARNAEGLFADQAAAKLEKFKIGKSTEAYGHYSGGKLPPAHIHARAKRYAVKLFLAHWHHVAYELHFGAPPPKPYILEQGGHVHFIGPPNWPM